MPTILNDFADMADNGIEQISELIHQTNDPQTRAVLLILYKIAATLQKNTEVTGEIVADMRTQDTAIRALTEQFAAQTQHKAGMNKVFTWIFPVTQSIILAACAYLFVDYIEIKNSVVEIKTTLQLTAKEK